MSVFNHQPIRRTRHGIIADAVIVADLLKEGDQGMLGILQKMSVDIPRIGRNPTLGILAGTRQAEGNTREFEARIDF